MHNNRGQRHTVKRSYPRFNNFIRYDNFLFIG